MNGRGNVRYGGKIVPDDYYVLPLRHVGSLIGSNTMKVFKVVEHAEEN